MQQRTGSWTRGPHRRDVKYAFAKIASFQTGRVLFFSKVAAAVPILSIYEPMLTENQLPTALLLWAILKVCTQ